jgi:sterol desaturase/sphingolipid hydroxylase (fatty acid hydroxylase superfamily)
MGTLQTPIGSYQFLFLLVIAVAILAEVIWDWRTDRKVYHLKETFANLVVFVGQQFFGKVVFAGVKLFVLDFAYKMTPLRIESNIWTFLLCFFLADFAYYFFHWVSHKSKLMWAFHHTHHSSMRYNLSGAYRLNWFGGLINLLFFLPLILVGFSPTFVVLSIALNLFYQFFLHTEAIGKLGILEKILNTPSAHRVHHATNEEYIDKNFGGVFIIWDRLFGTYQEESTKPKYGVTTGFVGYNPLKIVFKGFEELIKGVKSKS